MKIGLLTAIIAVISSLYQPAQAQATDDPGTYMNMLSSAQSDMNQKYMAYMSAAAHGRRAKKVEKLRQQVLESIQNSKYKTTDLPYYKGDKTLRQSSIDYIQLCYNVFNEDYGKIVNMEDIAEQSYDEMEAYILLQEKTGEKIHDAFTKMDEANKAFGAKYNVKIVESKSELGDKMETAAKLNHYQNEVYLLFFKCNWEDGEMMKAINVKKLNDAEQARSSLVRYADEGLKALNTLKSFDGDPSLAVSCKQALQFYKKMAEKDIPKMTDYYLKQENFDKIKKAMDARPASGRTKADIDTYNKQVNDMNAAVNSYNASNTQVNAGKTQMLNDWQKTEKDFADAHMPHYK